MTGKLAAKMVGSTPVLELEHVSKHFGGITAVDNFSLVVRSGDLRCLIGPNGAGKSTVFKLIMGMYPLTSGELVYKGESISRLQTWRRVRRGISIKMQVPGVFASLTARQNLYIAAQNYVTSMELDTEAERIFEILGISELSEQVVGTLSHGQQQWLEIGMALASHPELLLLDEPAAGMGPEETAYTAEIIRKLNAQGLTILFVEHDMDFVRLLASDVTVMHLGHKFAEGPIEEMSKDQRVIDIYLGK